MGIINRLTTLREKLNATGLDAILISQPENRFYASGFTGSAGFLIISVDHALLATDFRYFEQSARQSPHYQLVKMQGKTPLEWMHEAIAIIKPKKLGFEASNVTFSFYSAIKQTLLKIGANQRPKLVSTKNFVESLRIIKGTDEISVINHAAEIADSAFNKVTPDIQPGMTEKQVAWEMEKAMREAGADNISFDTIVASGPNGALPHHRPSDKVIQEGEPIVIDMGAKVNGYCSDITRTIIIGKPNDQLKKIYDTVLAAQLTAIETVESGMTGHQADELARNVIEKAGYGQNFGHSLGHGIGLAVHESPTIGPRSASCIEKDMVFTIEPGIYIPGWGGVRIEDMVELDTDKVRVITKTPKTFV